MKKLITLTLALAMVLTMSVSAFAAAVPGDSEDIDVTAKYNTTTSTSTVYSVDISWTSMVFTYNEQGSKVWNPEDHSYSTTTQGAWDKNTATVTVTNHSNAAVNVAMSYASVDGTGVTGSLSGGNGVLTAGVEGKHDQAAAIVGTLTISGTPNASVTAEGIKIGSITVKIS